MKNTKILRILMQGLLPLVLVISLILPAWVAQASPAPVNTCDDGSVVQPAVGIDSDWLAEGTASEYAEGYSDYQPCVPCSEIATQRAGDTDGTGTLSASDWMPQPLKVNVQVDLTEEDDIVYVDDILKQFEDFDWRTTVFVTGELALSYPEVVADIQDRGHEIGTHGWEKGEDISVLSYEEQLELIQEAFSAVRAAVDKPEEVLDFRPQSYAFNADTIDALQDFGARSISGVFSVDDHESFSWCWYVQSLGRVTFPYPITDRFWAIPVSTTEVDSEHVPLDDATFDDAEVFLDRLIAKYDQQTESGDPLVAVIHPSISGADETRSFAFAEFLEYVAQNEGTVKPLSDVAHHSEYIAEFSVSAPASATAREEVTVTVSYTATIWCPHYRFLIYGKYLGEDWDGPLAPRYCVQSRRGSYSFNRQITIPPPPPGESTYIVRVVGQASDGGCPLSIHDTAFWPSPQDHAVSKDVEIELEQRCIPVPGRTIGPLGDRINLVFVPDRAYGSPDDVESWLPTFLSHVNHKINNRLGGQPPVSSNLRYFNFYYTRDQGSIVYVGNRVDNCGDVSSLPEGLVADCDFADAIVVLHLTDAGDCSTVFRKPNIFSAEGHSDRSFIHEAGHGVFELADEYDGQTRYFQPDPMPNIWRTEDLCQECATAEGWDPDDCQQFTTRQGGWWKLGTTRYIMFDGNWFHNGWGPASERRINWIFDQLRILIDILYPCPWCPVYAEKLSEYSVDLHLNITGDELTLLESRLSRSPSAKYYPGEYPFRAEVSSLTGEVLGHYGFGDPRTVVAEMGYDGPEWRDNTDFRLSLPYFHNAQTVSIYNAPDTLLLSVDVSQHASGIIDGRVTDHEENPVSNAFIQVTGPGSMIGSSGVSTLTDQDGYYQLVALEPGRYEVSVKPDPYDNLMSTWAPVSVAGGDIVTQDFALSPAGSIAGTVTDAAGAPVLGARLYLSGFETPRYATNEEGRYIISSLSPGPRTVNIHAPDYDLWHIYVNNAYFGYGTSVPVQVTHNPTVWVDFAQRVHVETSTGTGRAYFTPSDGVIEGLEALPELPPGVPDGVTFPHGMFSFRVTGLDAGQTVTIEVELPDAVPQDFVWWKYDEGEWYDLPIDIVAPNIITITLTDGEYPGDLDGVADGTITDPGGPGNPRSLPSAPPGAGAEYPVWSILLAGIMAGASLWLLRHRQAKT